MCNMVAVKGALCAIVTLSVFISAENHVDLSSDHEWDVLIFTQHWPATVCMEWMQKSSKHSCSFPSQKDAWTVHGIWPTKLGTIGPEFCNKTIHFNKTALQPIESQLEQFWINVEKDTPLYGLWKHEWTKHGTCAVVVSNLDNEKKYFSQGLRWLQLYSMSDILLKSGFAPTQETKYNVVDMYKSVQSKIGKNPSMHCFLDPASGLSYIFEIRICFNKKLELIDCDGTKLSEEVNGSFGNLLHCDVNKPVIYTGIVPNVRQSYTMSEWPLIEIYKFITWLQWFTL